jgi:hypothetical protein
MGGQIGNYFSSGLGKVVGFIPNLISAVVILALGYLVSRLVASVARRLLARVGFDRFAASHLRFWSTDSKRSASGAVGSAVFWLGILVTLSLAANSLDLHTLSAGLNRILGFIPRVLIACVIIAVALAVSRMVAGLVGGAGRGALARGAEVAVMVLAVFMALDELGVSKTIVTTTFTALLGAAAVAAAIAFGVGNIGLAREYTQRWTLRARAEAPRAEEAVPPAPGETPGPTHH